VALAIEDYRDARVAGSAEARDFDLPVTTVFSREPDGWRIVHRHADPITTARPVRTVLPA
jgi:ketosteroid isomerase-like protein